MEKKIEKFLCKICEGEGYRTRWEDDEKEEDIENLVIEDCNLCEGLGKVDIKVIDKREKSKRKKLTYNKEY